LTEFIIYDFACIIDSPYLFVYLFIYLFIYCRNKSLKADMYQSLQS